MSTRSTPRALNFLPYAVALVLLGLGSFAAMVSVYNRTRDDSIDQLYNQELSLAHQASSGITSYFNYYKEILHFFASNPAVIRNEAEGKELLQAYFASQSGNILNITRVDEQGIIQYSYPDESVIGQNISEQAHIQTILSTHQPVLSSVFLTAQGYRSIAFHVPVFDGQRFTGSLAILIPFERISRQFVEELRVGKTGYAILLAADGTELFCPRPEHIGQSIYENIGGQTELAGILDQILAGNEGRYLLPADPFETHPEAQNNMFAYTANVTLENTFWVILVTAPEDEALANIQGFRDRWLIGMAFLVFGYSLWGFFLVRAYVRLNRDAVRKLSQEKIAAVENEREKALALLDAAVMQSPSGIVIANAPDMQIQIVNPAARRLRGQSERILTGIEFEPDAVRWLMFHSDGSQYEAAEQPLARAILRGELVQGEELILRDEQGQDHWILAYASPVRSHTGEIVAGIAIFQDVTDRRQAEEEIRQLNASLERRVEQRTAELADANNQLEAFSYSVSHDLRAPLRSINGFSHALQESLEGTLNAEDSHYLERIIGATRRMNELIDALLRFSRISRQSMTQTDISAHALDQMVRGVLEELLAGEGERTIQWRVNELAPCSADPILLRQVWANLLSNAVKYTRGRETARIEIGMTETPRGKAYSVRDNGVGFDMQYAANLFNVFQRMHSEGQFEGTGIGLALVQRIIQRHNGQIWAESQVDRGSTFFFTLD